MLNRLAGAERSIVSDVPGTTRDAVDMLVRHNDKHYRFVDTAGIRRKGKTRLGAEKLSVVMARRHLERGDVALLVADAGAGISAGDATIAGYAHESGRSVIVVMNKWDQAIAEAKRAAQTMEKELDDGGARRTARRDRRAQVSTDPAQLAVDYEKLVRERLKFLSYAPVIFISALTGERVDKLYALIDRVAQARRRRISTGELNRWLGERGPRPRHFAHRASRQNLLHHAGVQLASDLYSVHQPARAPAFQLRALPRKPLARGVRLYRLADPLHPARPRAQPPRDRAGAPAQAEASRALTRAGIGIG